MNREELIDQVWDRIILNGDENGRKWAERIVDEVITPLVNELQASFDADMKATIKEIEDHYQGDPNWGHNRGFW